MTSQYRGQVKRGRGRSAVEIAGCPSMVWGKDIQLEEPEHPHSPFMMTDFVVVGRSGEGVGIGFVGDSRWDVYWIVGGGERAAGRSGNIGSLYTSPRSLPRSLADLPTVHDLIKPFSQASQGGQVGQVSQVSAVVWRRRRGCIWRICRLCLTVTLTPKGQTPTGPCTRGILRLHSGLLQQGEAVQFSCRIVLIYPYWLHPNCQIAPCFSVWVQSVCPQTILRSQERK